jgi:two-component system, OmpR family, phosphate regulon sensor histidine kinase PhoR
MTPAMKNRSRARIERIQKSLRLTDVIVTLSVGVILPVLLSTSVGIVALVLGEESLSLVVGILIICFTSAAIGVAIVVTVILGKRSRIARMQADLLANVTHELRTPLSGIRMYAETLQLGLVNHAPEQQKACIDTIIREADWLETTIDRMLTWRALAKDRYNLSLEDTPLNQTIEEIASRFRHMVPPDVVTFNMDLATEVPVRHDPDAVGSIVLNLLTNAYKYSGDDKQISLILDERDGHARIRVVDNGIGIPQNQLDLILQPFHRVDTRLRGKSSGAGLGLAIVSHLVKAQAGSLSIETTEGEGSCFSVLLPISDHSS